LLIARPEEMIAMKKRWLVASLVLTTSGMVFAQMRPGGSGTVPRMAPVGPCSVYEQQEQVERAALLDFDQREIVPRQKERAQNAQIISGRDSQIASLEAANRGLRDQITMLNHSKNTIPGEILKIDERLAQLPNEIADMDERIRKAPAMLKRNFQNLKAKLIQEQTGLQAQRAEKEKRLGTIDSDIQKNENTIGVNVSNINNIKNAVPLRADLEARIRQLDDELRNQASLRQNQQKRADLATQTTSMCRENIQLKSDADFRIRAYNEMRATVKTLRLNGCQVQLPVRRDAEYRGQYDAYEDMCQ
jgi:hypothetical protein